MKRAFIALAIVATVFALGFVGLVIASFTTHQTDFAGTADLYLQFVTNEGKPFGVVLTDENDRAVALDLNGEVLLHPKFESRETNIFDRWLGGPRPRTAVVAFYESGHKRHEVTFTYNRHDRAWLAEVSFPDPTISKVEIDRSTLVFKGEVTDRPALGGVRVETRAYGSEIHARAVVGPPIISND